jgi:hypothetical protein
VLLFDAKAGSALRVAANDSDGRVAAAAGARQCRFRLPTEGPPLRQLALAEGAAAEDVVEMLPCLAVSTDPADARALQNLRALGSPAVRDAIKRLRENGVTP